MAGSVIQATGTVEFEDGLWIGNHLKAGNGLQWVRTLPGVCTPGFLWGQTESACAGEIEPLFTKKKGGA